MSMHNSWDLQSGIERETDNNSFQLMNSKLIKNPNLDINLGIQNSNDVSKLSTRDDKITGDPLTFITIPKEYTDFVFYPILE